MEGEVDTRGVYKVWTYTQDVRGGKERNRESKGGTLSIPGNRSGRSIRLSIGLQVCQKERSFCRIESCQGKNRRICPGIKR